MNEYQLLVKIDALKVAVERLAEENAQLRMERDLARADARAWVPVATPEEEEEFRRLAATAVEFDVRGLLAELEADGK